MKRTDKERFEDVTDRLLAQHAGFVSAVERIVTPTPNVERQDDAKRRLEQINAKRRRMSAIEAFCSSGA